MGKKTKKIWLYAGKSEKRPSRQKQIISREAAPIGAAPQRLHAKHLLSHTATGDDTV